VTADRAACPELGAEIGRGGSRIAYEIEGGRICKIPHGRKSDPERANRIEAAIWNLAPDDIREWLVPVLSHCPSGSWLIMPRGEPINPADRPNYPHKHLQDWRKVENWVRLGDRVLLCDYGQKLMARKLGIWRAGL
jgi:hypothetical protein